jgi:hypothetical protein
VPPRANKKVANALEKSQPVTLGASGIFKGAAKVWMTKGVGK